MAEREVAGGAPQAAEGMHAVTAPGREFLATKTVAAVLAGFRPARRTGTEMIGLDNALGRIPAEPLAAREPLPGFARSTVDGYAVRASDTYGASDQLPSYLTVSGGVQMGSSPAIAVAPGTAAGIPTGGMLPAGADAVVMIEHTQQAAAGTIEVLRPVAPGEGVVRADEDAVAGAILVPAGRPLRAQDLGMLAAAGITRVPVHERPRVTIVSTGDEVVPPETATLAPGQVRDATAAALAAMVTEAGGEPSVAGIIADDAGRLEQAIGAALAGSDLVVVSAGSSVGARDETATAIRRLGPPGIWCHGIAIKPGKPTLLAECGTVPVVGLPGNPRSAMVVFRLIGMPLVRIVGGCSRPPAEPVIRLPLQRPVASAAGRLDVVQVRIEGGQAVPVFGASALLAVLTAADGYLVIGADATGLDAGTEVEVTLYR